MIVIAIVVLVLAVPCSLFYLPVQICRDDHAEPHVREEIARDGNAKLSSAFRGRTCAISRHPRKWQANIASLLREYLSLQVVAVYAGCDRSILSNVSGGGRSGFAVAFE